MANKIILKDNGILNTGNAPTGYKYLGYDGETISEKNGATVSAIGGSSLGYLQYKALISQNAPVATTNQPTMIVGQIWNMDVHNAADDARLLSYIASGYLELISGTINTNNSKYRAVGNNFDFSILFPLFTTTFSYDGAPYVVSTDANGDIAPTINTLGAITFQRNYAGVYEVISDNLFTLDKTYLYHNIGQDNGGDFGNINPFYLTQSFYHKLPTYLVITTYTSEPMNEGFVDGWLYYTSITIEVYP